MLRGVSNTLTRAGFGSVQRRTFVKVLGIASNVQRQVGVDQIIAAARQAIVSRQKAQVVRLEQAKRTARTLQQATIQILESIAGKLRVEVSSLSPDFQFKVDSETNEGHRRHYFKGQVVDVAKELDYFANVSVYQDWRA